MPKMVVFPVRLDRDILKALRKKVRHNPETDASKEIRKALRKVLFE
jgi:hypothetical protein